MATHSSVLAWRIPWTEKPGRLQSTGSQRIRQDWLDKAVNRVISLVTFCDFGFHSISPLIDKDKRLLEAS